MSFDVKSDLGRAAILQSSNKESPGGKALANESAIFLFGHAVGTSRHLLDAGAVEDHDLISAGLDQLLSLETLQRLRDSGPPHSQHQRQEFVGERQHLVASSVMRHQNPPRQTLVDMGACVRDRSVSRLHHEDLNVFQQQGAQ